MLSDLEPVLYLFCKLSAPGVFTECPNEFTVDARSVSPTAQGKVKAIVTSPSGQRTDTLVKNKGDGTYSVLYTPVEKGEHSL